MILQTQRLTLRPLADADAAAMHAIMSDVEVMAHWDIDAIEDPDLTGLIVGAQVREAARDEGFYWAVTRLDDGAFLGCADLSDLDRWHQRAEIGFIFGRHAWGQGYGLEAMRSVVVQAAAMDLRRLTARTHVGNLKSEALLTKLGFEIEGYLRGHIQRGGERRDCRIWGLLL